MMSSITGKEVLSIAALGRPFHLGMLYDCRSDKLIPGITLWDQNNLDRKSVQTLETANFEVITSDSLENKSYALDINAELKLSFLGGLLDISGSGEYLENRKSRSHHERITLKYKCTTRSERMIMEQLGKGNMQHPEVFEMGIATHVVTGITYGGNAFFVFDREVTSDSDRREAHGRLQALVTKIPNLYISGKGDLKLSDEDKNEVEKIHCRYYGDFLPRENPSTFKDAVNLYRMLPDLLGENKEKAVPIKVQLYPLSLLDSKGCKLVRDISIELVRETEGTFESLFALELRCNDLLESETVKKFRRVRDEIQRFLSLLKTYRLKLQRELSLLLPEIRGGGKEESELANILEKDKMSPFSQYALLTYIQGLERNFKILSKFTDALSLVKFSEPEDLESSIMNHADSTVLCFSILIPKTSFCIDEMEKYLRKEKCKTDPPLDVGNDCENPAKRSPGRLSMMRKARNFVEFFKANTKSDNASFIVSYKYSDSCEFGAKINYFHDGELQQQDFDIPTAPGKPVSDENDNTDSSIVVKWNLPSSGAANIVKYKVHYNKIHEENATFELDAGLSNNGYHIKNLKPACDYSVCIQGVCEVGATICSDKSDPIKTKPAIQDGEPAKSELCKISDVIEESQTLIIYQPQPEVIYDNKIKMLRKLQLGLPSQKTEEKVIMLVGETGSGKTTLINGLINYIFGVQWDDPFRFKLITEPLSSNQAQSQTIYICTYTIYHQEGFRVPYNLTIIDTPGFGDVSGIQRDQEITKQISDLFSTKGSYGIDHLDAVGFVASSSNPRLTPTQRYIFNQVLSIFGKDIADNIFMLFTFCDGQTPQVLSGVKDAKIPYQEYFKFNNSALYSCKDRGGSSKFDAMFWQMGAESFETFLEVLKRTSSKSLVLTENVLRERKSLQHYIASIRKNINLSLNKLEQLETEREILQNHEADIERNKNFEYTVFEERPKKQYLDKQGQHTTICVRCNRTCHEDCEIPLDLDKHKCIAMDKKGNCKHCTPKCNWKLHQNLPYIIVYERVPVRRTAEDLKKRYQEASDKKLSKEFCMAKIRNELLTNRLEALEMTEKVRGAIAKLKEIALQPDPITTPEYIQLMIEAEKVSRKSGWQERIKQLGGLQEEAEYMRDIALKGQDPFEKYGKLAEAQQDPKAKSKMLQALEFLKVNLTFLKDTTTQYATNLIGKKP